MAVEEAVAFVLHASVMALIEDMPGASVEEIAERLYDEIPEQERRRLLVPALTLTIKKINYSETASAMANEEKQRISRDERAKGVAWKVRLLRSRVLVNGVFREFGTFTCKELIDAAKERETVARQTLHRAQQLKACAAIMQSRGFATVAEIPEAALRKIFNA